MDDNKFWLSLWSVVAVAVVCLGVMLLISSRADNRALTEMVAKGADPMRAACALRIQPSTAAGCVLQGAK